MTSEAERVFLEFENSLTEVRRMVATELVQELEKATPKKSGYAASGWNIAYGASLSPQEPTPSSFSAKLAQVSGRISRMMSSIAAFSSVRRGSEGSSLRVYNDTAYIGKLNEGYSSQAPAGFIQTTISAVAAKVQAFVNSNSRMSGSSKAFARRDLGELE